MSNVQIPFNSSLGNQSFFVALDGTTFKLDFRYNTRGKYWSFSILTANEVCIVSGMRVVSDYSLLSHFTDERLPKGRLYCLDQFFTGRAPEFSELGDTHVLIYEPAS